MNKCLLALVVLMSGSFQAMARVSIEEKENRVQFIEKLGSAAPSLSVAAYRRELEYEKQELPLNMRAQNEARLLAEQIQSQIISSYEKALSAHGDSQKAIFEVKQAIGQDLKLAAPEFRKELLSLADKTLEGVEHGGSSYGPSLSNLEKTILPNVKERAKFLNTQVTDGEPDEVEVKKVEEDKLEYRNTSELMETLVSDSSSTRWVATSNQVLNSAQTTQKESELSFRINIEFLGVSVEAGPTIIFRREYATNVNIMGEEISPVILPDGNFDFNKKNMAGKVIYKQGKPVRRYFAFFCEANLKFSTEYKGSGGFKIVGIGGGTTVIQNYSNSVSMSTRRVLVPNTIDGETVTMAYLAKICHGHFLKAKVGPNLTVEKSLNISMQNVISGLRFSHPKTSCAVDTQCINWFNDKISALWRHMKSYPRCVDDQNREGFRSCQLRGLEGMACRVYNGDNRLISPGSWELDCDKGLKCVKTKSGGFLRVAKGECRPINPSTYCDPKICREYKTLEDDFIMVRTGRRR